MIVREVIEAARDRLGDTDKTGWDEKRLVRLVNAGQKDICKLTSVYRRKTYIGLLKKKTLYTLPSDCIDITRVEYMDKQLPIYSREDLDALKRVPGRYAVKSNMNRSLIELYPSEEQMLYFDGYILGTEVVDGDIRVVPDVGVLAYTDDIKSMSVSTDLGVLSSMHEDLTCHAKTNYGDICGSNLFTELDLTLNTPPGELGVLAGMEFSGTEEFKGFLNELNGNYVEGSYGICTEALFKETYVIVYYKATPTAVTWVDSALVLEDIWFDALVHYVVGNARQDDNDEGNYAIGERELAKYAAEVAVAAKLSAKNYTSQVSGVRETIYRRF